MQESQPTIPESSITNQALAKPKEQEYKWDSSPLSDDDKKVFFACRKTWVEGSKEAESDIDEKTYDTTSIDPNDIIPYLVTMGYKSEKERMTESLTQILKIKDLRKKYDVPPLSGEPWVPKWKYKCMSCEEIEQQWPLNGSGTNKDGLVVLWDKSGNLDESWTASLMKSVEAKNAVTFYCVRQIENLLRFKIRLSKQSGIRMTRHISILDAYNMGITNVTSVRSLMDQILGDVQVMYPETLKKLYIINAGWLFKAAWTVVRNFIHPITAQKVVILGTNYKETLEREGITKIPSWVM